MTPSRVLRRTVAVAAVLTAVAACGPANNIEAGVVPLVTDVLLGAPIQHDATHHDVSIPSFPGVAPTGPVIDKTAPIVPPVPVLACPPADPDAFPPRAVSQMLNQPPTPGRYSYRQHGSAERNNKHIAKLPKQAVWRVRSMKPPLPSYSYAFSVTAPGFQGATTTTDYAVIKPPINVTQTIPATNITIQPIGGGIYITRIVTRSHGVTSTFSPLAPGVELIGQPMIPGASWTSLGVDVTHALTMSVTGKVVGDKHVNACGQQLDAWRVEVSSTIYGLSENVVQTETYDVGSEYGGLLLAVQRRISGTLSGQTFAQLTTATINSIKPLKAQPKHTPSHR
jgi:hypothetical protein